MMASGAGWESEAFARLTGAGGIVVLKRCVDVDDLLATATSGQADVEIVVHGRKRDVEGTSDLIRRVADGMEGAGGGPVG